MIDARWPDDDAKWWRMNEVINFVNNSGAMGFFLFCLVFPYLGYLHPHRQPIQKSSIHSRDWPQMHCELWMHKRLVWYAIQLSPMHFLHKFTYTPYMKLTHFMPEIAYHLLRSTVHGSQNISPVIVKRIVCRENAETGKTFERIEKQNENKWMLFVRAWNNFLFSLWFSIEHRIKCML